MSRSLLLYIRFKYNQHLSLILTGGPGSGKWSLCQKVVQEADGWVSLSVGKVLRTAADAAATAEDKDIRKAMVAGDMVDKVMAL